MDDNKNTDEYKNADLAEHTEDDKKNWVRRSFKGNKVWAEASEEGTPIETDGKVLIRYQLKHDYEYRVHREALKSVDPANLTPKGEKKKTAVKKPINEEHPDTPPDGIVRIYTDGASSGNPGPSGIGAVLQYGTHEKKISKFIGTGTNNIAELEAIRVALVSLKKTDLPIRLYTDSSYALGLLVNNWKATKNTVLAHQTRSLLRKFKDIKLIKVKGHVGIKGNELADSLATQAVKEGRK